MTALRIAFAHVRSNERDPTFNRFPDIHCIIRAYYLAPGTASAFIVIDDYPSGYRRSYTSFLTDHTNGFLWAKILAKGTVIAFILIHQQLFERSDIRRCLFSFNEQECITEPCTQPTQVALLRVYLYLPFYAFLKRRDFSFGRHIQFKPDSIFRTCCLAQGTGKTLFIGPDKVVVLRELFL